MKNITSLFSMQWRIYAPGVVPYRFIITPWGTAFLQHYLNFREADWNGEDYVFQDGTFKGDDDNEQIFISAISFNDRRVVVQVRGDRDAANIVVAVLGDALGQLDRDYPAAVPLLVGEETSCVAQLNFDWTALLSPAMVEQAKEWAEAASAEDAEKAIKGVSVRFTLNVKPSQRLTEYGVNLWDQTLTVEPRVDMPLSERTYFTYSPCDSENHLKLLAGLEAKLSRKASRTSKR